MPTVMFTPNLRRHLECPPSDVRGDNLRAVLDAVFVDNPALRGYILDDQGALRRHVTVFIDNKVLKDRTDLTDPVAAGGEVFVMQALSGG